MKKDDEDLEDENNTKKDPYRKKSEESLLETNKSTYNTIEKAMPIKIDDSQKNEKFLKKKHKKDNIDLQNTSYNTKFVRFHTSICDHLTSFVF
jgi:hypothetical protein